MSMTPTYVGNALDLGDAPITSAFRVSDYVWTAGVVPIDPVTGEVVSGGIDVQAARALENLATVLQCSGSSLEKVVSIQVYLADIESDLAEFNRVYATYFPRHHPARHALGVTLAWPSLRVELQAVATCEQSQ